MTIVTAVNDSIATSAKTILMIDRPEGSVLRARLCRDATVLPIVREAALRNELQGGGQAERVIDDVSVGPLAISAGKASFVVYDASDELPCFDRLFASGIRCDAALLIAGVDDDGANAETIANWLRLSGASIVVVAIEAGGPADIDAKRLATAERSQKRRLEGSGVEIAAVVPVCASQADDLLDRSLDLPWYLGPTLGEALEACGPAPRASDPLRMTVTGASTPENSLLGRIESGTIALGDDILLSPSNRVAKVIELADSGSGSAIDRAGADRRVAIALDGNPTVEPGELISHRDDPPLESTVFRIRLAWSAAAPLTVPSMLSLRPGASPVALPVTVERIERVIEPSPTGEADQVPRAALADVIVRAERVLAIDTVESGLPTGRVVLIDGETVVGVGGIDMTGYPDQRQLLTRRATNVTEVIYRVDPDMRAVRNGHAGGVLWFTGLSGAGKTTLAVELERELFGMGYQVYILDGDNLRHGLNANLGFSPEDRAENIRRVGEVAALFAEAGVIVVSAFISPYLSDRERARDAALGQFHEIFVKADLSTCERRDTKGLYKKARAGEITDFTGISAPYEAPEACELVVDTDRLSVSESIDLISAYVQRAFPLTKP